MNRSLLKRKEKLQVNEFMHSWNHQVTIAIFTSHCCLGDELSLEQKLVVFSLLEKKESIKQLANGSGVTLFCTPQDVNLNLAAFGGSMEQMHGKVLQLPQVVEKKVREGKQEVQ